MKLRTLPSAATAVPLHLTVDPWWDVVTAIAFGRVDDGLPSEQMAALEEDSRISFYLDSPGSGPVIGFSAREVWEIDVAELESGEIWDGPRFAVPTLALVHASVGEILLAVRGRFAENEPTADAMHFHLAIGSAADEGEELTDYNEVIAEWRLALEAGDIKALFGLGYTLVEAGRPREAYGLLRRYTELTPCNAWAWCWLGKACAALGQTGEARAAYERAVACEREGSFETDAAEFLTELGNDSAGASRAQKGSL